MIQNVQQFHLLLLGFRPFFFPHFPNCLGDFYSAGRVVVMNGKHGGSHLLKLQLQALEQPLSFLHTH